MSIRISAHRRKAGKRAYKRGPPGACVTPGGHLCTITLPAAGPAKTLNRPPRAVAVFGVAALTTDPRAVARRLHTGRAAKTAPTVSKARPISFVVLTKRWQRRVWIV